MSENKPPPRRLEPNHVVSTTSNINEQQFPQEWTAPQRDYWDSNQPVEIETAMEYAEVGKFQIFLLIVCCVAFATTAIAPNVLNEFGDSVQCDLQLIKEDKEAINDIVYVCMILGGVGWSILADTLSRKWSLIFVLLINFIATISLSFSGTFLFFGLFRGLSAFSLSGVTCITVVFLAEFQSRYNRGTMIAVLQLAWVLGMVTFPSLPLSWSNRILVGSIPSLFAIFALTCFPDSPRFLLSRGRHNEAINSVRFIHFVNTGKRNFENPIYELVDNETPEAIKRTSPVAQYIPRNMRPKFYCFLVLLFSQFTLMFSYYTMAIWFPTMAAREESFFLVRRDFNQFAVDCTKAEYQVNYSPDLAMASDNPDIEFVPTKRPANKSFTTLPPVHKESRPENPCTRSNKKDYGLHARRRLLIALSCMPAVILLISRIDAFGRNFFIVLSHILGSCLVFASYFLQNGNEKLIFICFFEALALLSISAAHCLAVDLFPTRVRVLGLALMLAFGQLGVILGNMEIALKMGSTCVIVIDLIACILAVSGLLVLAIPNTVGVALR